MEQNGLIVGGGIGGLVTALALNKFGIKSVVCERADVLQEVGAGLVLAPNALFVLDQLGIRAEVDAISWPLAGGQLAESNGRILQKMPTLSTPAMQQRHGYGVVVVHRGKLQRLLLDALPSDQVRTGKRLVQLTDNEQQVCARFADGSTMKGRFLIGADGIRSVVREQLFGTHELRYSGQTCWRSIVRYTLPFEEQATAIEYWGRMAGLRVGIVPCGPDEVYLYLTAIASPNGNDDLTPIMPQLKAIGKQFISQVSQIIDCADETSIHRADLFDLPTLPTWSKGLCTLLGDAAHATTPNIGQGACQAIEDGFAIAACLAQNASVAEAFQQYEYIRKPKADRVVKISRQIGQALNLPGWLKPPLFLLMRLAPPSRVLQQFDAVYTMDYARQLGATASQYRPAHAG